jgi:hypothetical protein
LLAVCAVVVALTAVASTKATEKGPTAVEATRFILKDAAGRYFGELGLHGNPGGARSPRLVLTSAGREAEESLFDEGYAGVHLIDHLGTRKAVLELGHGGAVLQVGDAPKTMAAVVEGVFAVYRDGVRVWKAP